MIAPTLPKSLKRSPELGLRILARTACGSSSACGPCRPLRLHWPSRATSTLRFLRSLRCACAVAAMNAMSASRNGALMALRNSEGPGLSLLCDSFANH